jgi:hypothetical protein
VGRPTATVFFQNFPNGFEFEMVKRWSPVLKNFHIKYVHVGNLKVHLGP